MKKILIPSIILLLLSGCDSTGNANACVYSNSVGVLYCLENATGNEAKFLGACKDILKFQRLKDRDASLAAVQSCPLAPKATCLNGITDIADQHFYDDPSQDMAQLRRICEKGDGSFVLD
ncbi:MAG: hypothetical protein KBT88_12465 [Gammaproteobacteria bacterium]|nr:hypothetical protein [Gammaproteobacteria bacterium]MBQ0840589.1 hypothetical protein [Gammaproteobacteria bacterium]